MLEGRVWYDHMQRPPLKLEMMITIRHQRLCAYSGGHVLFLAILSSSIMLVYTIPCGKKNCNSKWWIQHDAFWIQTLLSKGRPPIPLYTLGSGKVGQIGVLSAKPCKPLLFLMFKIEIHYASSNISHVSWCRTDPKLVQNPKEVWRHSL